MMAKALTAYLTWQATYGNGWLIGIQSAMTRIRWKIRLGLIQGSIEYYAAAPGTRMSTFSALQPGLGVPPPMSI